MMIRNLLRRLPAVLAVCALWACGSDDPADAPDPPAPPSQPVEPEHPPVVASRTILVYMVADNSLGKYGFDEDDLEEMREAKIPEGGRLLVYHSRPGTDKGLPPILIEITPQGDKILKEYPDSPDIYSTDPERMAEVMADADRFAPSDSPLGMVFWSHGTGWQSDSGAKMPAKRSFGSDRGQKMAIPTLDKALATHEPLAFIYFDCCHMTCVEVAYEIRKRTPVIIGSLSELPAEGTRYDLVLPLLFAADYQGAARATFSYFDSMENIEARTCTMSLIETAGLDRLGAETRAILEHGDPLPKPRDEYQAFMRSRNTIFDLSEYITSLPSASASWSEALNEVVKYSAATPSIFNILPVNTFCGLGCYIFTTGESASYMGYDSLQWYRDVVSHNPSISK